MPIILKNNVDSTLAQAINASETAAIVAAGDGAKFPALGSGDYFYATLVSAQGTREIVKVTSKSIDTLAITRAQEGTTANGFAVGSRVEMRVTAASITDLVDEHDQAVEISIADAGNYYTSTNVEGALQEAAVYNEGSTGAVTRVLTARLQDYVSVKDFGAVGNGVANDSTAFQNAVDSGAGRVHVPDGIYLLTSLVTITSTVVLFGSGTIKEAVLREATILVDTADDVGFNGLTFEGPETLANWNAGGGVYRQAYKAFIKFDACNRGFVKNTRSSGKRTTVWATGCNKLRIEGNNCDGFFGVVASGSPADPNWAPAYFVQGGTGHQITDNEANKNGSVVLFGNDSSHNVVMNTVGQDNHDNGIYNSSGDYSSFIGGTFTNPGGSALKIRGRAHTVSGNTIRNTKTLAAAISLTGNGLTPDAFNSNGFGTVCIGNTLENIDGVGIFMGGQDGLFARDFVIANNTIENHTPGLVTESAILINATRGVKVTGNIIRGSTASYALGIFGPGGGAAPYVNRAIGFDVSGNTVSDAVQAIRAQNVEQSLFNNNVADDIVSSTAFDFRLCEDNMISGNRINGAGIKLSSTLGEECIGNVATNNDITSYGATDVTVNVVALPIEYLAGVWSATFTTTGTDFGSVTYTAQQGFYTKVGRLVTVSGHIETSAITVGGATGDVVIGGLPFQTSNAGTGVRGAGSVYATNFAGDVPIGIRVDRNTSVLRLTYRASVNGNNLLLAIADLTTGSGNLIYFTCTYTTDD